MDNIIFRKKIPGIFAEESELRTDFSMASHHIHEGTEIYLLLDGERYYFIDQDTYHIKSGMAVIVHPNQIHRTCNVKSGEGHHRFLLQLEPYVLEKFLTFSDIPTTDFFEENYRGATMLSADDFTLALSITDRIKKEMLSENSESNTLTLLLVFELLTVLVRNFRRWTIVPDTKKPFKYTVDGSKQIKVHEIALYLQNHLTDNCSLDEISARFFISRSQLTRMFKSITGLTVNEYLTICRIRNAKTLLDKTDLSITEISMQTGFGNITYFERVFKRITGMTPLQYRKWDRYKVN